MKAAMRGLLVRLFIFFGGLAMMLAAFVCWGFQMYTWLKHGIWLAVPISSYVHPGGTGWLGIDKILLWLSNINIGIPLLFGGFWIMALSAMDWESA